MLSPEDVASIAASFGRACTSAGVAYAFAGGVAVMAWGQPRATVDIDALVRYEAGDADALATALEDLGFRVAERDLRAGLDDDSHVSVFVEGSPFHVDLNPALDPLVEEEIDDAVTVEIDEGPIRVVRPEETIAYKLAYGSPQDLADARSILVRRGDRLDRDRLRRFVDRLDVAGRLEELASETRRSSGEE